MSQLKPLAAACCSLAMAASSQLSAQPVATGGMYQEPTRGFFIEHGLTAPNRQASVELHSGTDIDAGGGVRLGLQGAELIFNSGLRTYDVNEILVKYQMPELGRDKNKTDHQNNQYNAQINRESNSRVHWALVAGLAHLELEDDNSNAEFEQTNIKLGVAATVTADAATFTIGPRLVLADGDRQDDTFVEVDLGAYVGLIDTQSGLFSAGAEAIITTEDGDAADDRIAFGLRWQYNPRLTMDIVPIVLENGDQLGLPGLVRVNARF